MQERTHKVGDTIYSVGEQPSGIFLIIKGFLAYIAIPSPLGGIQNIGVIANLLKLSDVSADERYDIFLGL